MKKNEVINETENVVMNEEEMQQYIAENESIVPASQRKKFAALDLKSKVAKIKFYYDVQRLREDAKIKNSIPNKVKDLFELKHGTVEDARDVLKFCNDFIDGFKQREIERIDTEIAKLQAMKQSL